MEYQNKVKYCLTLIKEQVKKQSVNYQQLADKLNVSLLTVKRQLNGNEISMSKLLVLCDAIGINFSELWQTVENQKIEHTFFTKEQDNSFYKYPHLFQYFVEILQQKKSPRQLQQHWKLTQASTHIYLRKLEQLNLIKLSQQGTISFLVTEPLGFDSDSQFVKKDIQNALNDVAERLGSSNDKKDFLLIKPMVLSDQLRKKMYGELTEVISRYAQLSERYFTLSEYPAFQLITCDYKLNEDMAPIEIINVNNLS